MALTSPALSSAASSARSCSAESGVIALSRGKLNSRPMALANWATNLAGPSWSSRAISESWSVVGMASSGSGPRASAASRRPPSSMPRPSTAWVSSSMNSGIPSARVTTCSSTVCGIRPAPATCSTRWNAAPRGRRWSSRPRTCDLFQGAAKSGRKVKIAKADIPPMLWTSSERNSRVVGSAQCRSSMIMSSGWAAAWRRTCRSRRSKVSCFRRWALIAGSGGATSAGIDRRAASIANSWVRSPSPLGKAASFSSFVAAGSSGPIRAASSMCWMTGCSARLV